MKANLRINFKTRNRPIWLYPIYICLMRLVWILCFLPFFGKAQNPEYAKSIISYLCSDALHGRGYVQDGCALAADFILKEIRTNSTVQTFPNGFSQEFYFPVNTFPGELSLSIDGQELPNDGSAFLVDPASPTFNGTYRVMRIDSAQLDGGNFLSMLTKKKVRHYFLLLDPSKLQNIQNKQGLNWLKQNGPGFRGIIEISDKLTWSVSQTIAAYPTIHIKRRPEIQFIHQVSLSIESDYHRGFVARNIIAYIKGKQVPDSFIVFTAHYDHLGQMGHHALFPGANDNAGGVAMLLDLMKYYDSNPPNLSVAFIFFAGEEAGLVGSTHYCNQPFFELSHIKFLLNLDLVTTGQEGMMVVNATAHPEKFDALSSINDRKKHLPKVQWRSNAANSDHYPFTLRGVPAFFIYLMGPYPYYHEPEDEPRHINLSHYEASFTLIKSFANLLMN